MITFVTGNENKLREVKAILGAEGNLTNKSLDLEEVQGTIEAVTIHKAKLAAQIVGGPVLVEDTCLAFKAFNSLPGPYIKWFVSSMGLDNVVKMLAGFEDKSARAVCTFGYCPGPGEEVQLFQGETWGTIVESRGPTSFGWDSIFQPDGYNETYAEMDKAVKNLISHRFRALEKLKVFLASQ